MWKMFINSVLNVGAFYKKNRLYFVSVYCLNKIIVFVCVPHTTTFIWVFHQWSPCKGREQKNYVRALDERQLVAFN